MVEELVILLMHILAECKLWIAVLAGCQNYHLLIMAHAADSVWVQHLSFKKCSLHVTMSCFP